MTIQYLLTLAIEAIFYCFTTFIAMDIFIRCTAPFAVPEMPKKIKPTSLDELENDGIYNFGLALALSDSD